MARGDLIINATSVGMGQRSDDFTASPVDASLLRTHQVVVDLVYHPRKTAFLALAARTGCTTVDGLGMLIHQAALQQQIWTGEFPDVEAMTRAANEVLETSQAQQ
jgi:shikimate dehydrogenase